jgi:hypothetical protein
VDGRVKPGHDDVVGMQVNEDQKKDELNPDIPKPEGSEAPKLRPIGLDVGKVVIHESFFDPLPDEFCGF